MAAAAAAVAASSQWPNSAVTPNQQSGQQFPLPNGHAPNGSQMSSGLGGLDSQPQVAALAAAVAAQQQLAAWRWPAQHNGTIPNQATHAVLASSPVVSTSASSQGTVCSLTANGQQQQSQQQQVSSPLIESLQQLLRAQQAHTTQQQLLAAAAILSGQSSFAPVLPQQLMSVCSNVLPSPNYNGDGPEARCEAPNSPYRSAKRPRLKVDDRAGSP